VETIVVCHSQVVSVTPAGWRVGGVVGGWSAPTPGWRPSRHVGQPGSADARCGLRL